jgi:hypothetical protein
VTAATCARCRLPAPGAHATEAACIAALGAALEAAVRDLDALKRDLAERRAHDAAVRELHAAAEEDMSRGG